MTRARPYFQMGSFIGYPVLGPLVPLLRRLGGFCVMRPKEVLRLKGRRGWDRDRARAMMRTVNEEAEKVRLSVLRSAGTLVVFPEGTRDDAHVRPMASDLEIAVKEILEGKIEIADAPASEEQEG